MIDENWILPFGKHKDEALKDVPTAYLIYLYDHKKLSGELKTWCEENIPILKVQKRQQDQKRS
jgi:uncharacterized protein (DUF3820 family)